MVCYLTCGIGLAMIVATLTVMFFGNSFGIMKQYEDTLTPELKEKYRMIVRERAMIFIQGTIIGLFFGLLYIRMNKDADVCAFLLLVVLIQYMYYTLIPKKDYMLNHLTTEGQIQAWLQVYKYMKLLYHAGFAVTIVGFLVFFRGTCSLKK
jgi:hypothetical protein